MNETGARKTRARRRDTSASDDFLQRHISELQELRRPVVLIAGGRTTQSLPGWRAAFQYRLHVIVADAVDLSLEGVTNVDATSNDAMAEYISSIGPVAAVIDEQAPTLVDRLQRWQRFFFHVTAGGSFVTPQAPAMSTWDAATTSLASRRIGTAEIDELRDSIATTRDTGGYTVTVKSRDHLLKVKDEDAIRILPTRLGANNVLILGSVRSGSNGENLTVESHGTRDHHTIPARRMRYPELSLREFRGTTDLKDEMLAVNGATVLPSSFKHPWRAWNARLHNFNDQVAVLRDGDEQSVPLQGTYYDLTASVAGDQGRFLTETVPKLWGWEEAKQRDPELRALYRTTPTDPNPAFQRAVLEAYGIAPEDVHFEHRNVSVERFVSASQGWQNGGRHFVHPVNGDIWAKVRSVLVPADEASPRKIFVTRGAESETPGPRNREEVERLFSAHGFEVVDVAELSVADQARVFGNATTIAGFAGSGMYDMLFAGNLEKVFVLTHEANTGRNEHLFASLLAEEIQYFWSKPDIDHPAGKFSSEAFNSPWDFDFESNRSALSAALA